MGLKKNDLQDLVKREIEIDTYSSKMGEDKNIITLSFSVKDEDPSDDLVKFLESGYDFVLDAAKSSGEQNDGYYRVFVEMPRNETSVQHILEILNGVENLTGEKFKFRYYKNFKYHDVSEENLTTYVVTDPDQYGIKRKVAENQNADNFFKKSFIDSYILSENLLILNKKYCDPLYFNIIDFDTQRNVHANINESYNYNDFGEVIYLVKYLGDYDITKYGNKIIIENNGYCLVTERL